LKIYPAAVTLTTNTPQNIVTVRPGILPGQELNPYGGNVGRQASRVGYRVHLSPFGRRPKGDG